MAGENTYIIFALRNTSQFEQERQTMRCKVLEVHDNHIIVESLKRYNIKYPDSERSTSETYQGMPVRRINRDQARVIIDENSKEWLSWETMCSREVDNNLNINE